jgi:hypothetical protein
MAVLMSGAMSVGKERKKTNQISEPFFFFFFCCFFLKKLCTRSPRDVLCHICTQKGRIQGHVLASCTTATNGKAPGAAGGTVWVRIVFFFFFFFFFVNFFL